MNLIKLPYQQIIFTTAIALALVTNTCGSRPIKAQSTKRVVSTVRFIPPPLPDRGTTSGRQRGGASRGDCPSVAKPLTALVPATQETLSNRQGKAPALTSWESVFGLTTAASPTLWFYIPYALTSKTPIEFVLQDEQGNNIYKTSFTTDQGQPGIVSFSLPSTATALKVGKMYHWYLIIDCAPDNPPAVEGWIKRVAINSTLTRRLQTATPQQRVALYATNGIWYDALTTLAELRGANPEDATLLNDWVSLLHSVGLDALMNEPLTQCCAPEETSRANFLQGRKLPNIGDAGSVDFAVKPPEPDVKLQLYLP